MLQLAAHANKLAIVTQTYAHRVMRLIAEKVRDAYRCQDLYY